MTKEVAKCLAYFGTCTVLVRNVLGPSVDTAVLARGQYRIRVEVSE